MTYKVVTCVTTYNRYDYLKKFVESWVSTKDDSFDNYLIVADDGSSDGLTKKYISAIKSKNIIIIENNRVGISSQTNSLLKKSIEIGFDYGFKCDDDIWFEKKGWQSLYINAINSSKYDHLCYYNSKWIKESRKTISVGLLKSKTSVIDCMGCFWTFTPNVIKEVGMFDEKSFGFMGHEHIDYSMRCCRAGFNNMINLFDANYSNEYINMVGRKEGYKSSIHSAQIKICPKEKKKRWSIIFNKNRIKI